MQQARCRAKGFNEAASWQFNVFPELHSGFHFFCGRERGERR